MDRLSAMQVFVAVAEERSFARAARRLGLSSPSVTRAIAALEGRLGAKLLLRTTRVVQITEVGASYLTQCRRILTALEEADLSVAQAHDTLIGSIAVTAPVLFGRLCVAPVLLEFLGRYPRVAMRAMFSDQVLDLLEQNIDVAVRIGELPSSSLSATRVGAVRRVVCASPAYLRKHGVPQRPVDLASHSLIVVSGFDAPLDWTFSHGGRPESFSPRARLSVNQGDLAIDAACAGHGIARLLSYQVEAEVRNKRLRIVLEPFERAPAPVHVIHTAGRSASARVRAFVDFAVSVLRAKLRDGSAA